MKVIILVVFSAISFSVFSQKKVNSVPDWYKNPPKMEAEKVYGVGRGKSVKMGFADNKATFSAKENIAYQINPPKKVKKHRRIFFWRKNQPVVQEPTQTNTETITNLKNIEVLEKVFMQNKDGFTVYVLLVMERNDSQ